jgi:NAD(P)-dependent dehydrogenase (short-subunit alcohol dehydrogenase family)
MKIAGSVALVTGANRGIGAAYTRSLLERGAAVVYGAARDPETISEPGVKPIKLDIADPAAIERAVQQCGDVNLVVNNAGILLSSPLIGAPDLAAARAEMDVNYWGTLAMCRAFAPVLATNGGGALVNVLSVVTWFTPPETGSYAVSKAAAWAMTNGIRVELAAQGTLVVGVHVGFVDTDMAAGINAPKTSPVEVARQTLDAIEAGRIEVLTDAISKQTKANLSRDHELIYPAVQAEWDALTRVP